MEGHLRQVAGTRICVVQARKGYVEKQACQQVILLSCILKAYLKENTGIFFVGGGGGFSCFEECLGSKAKTVKQQKP